MSDSLQNYGRLPHGDLGIGKRPDELNWPVPEKFDLSTAEAGEILGITSKHVAELVRLGKLPARKLGGHWFVRRRDVEQMKAGQP